MPPSAPERGSRNPPADAAAVAALLLLAVFYHAPELAGKGVVAFVDSSRFFFPMWKWAASAWREGILPLWNPSLGCGQPFFADPQTASAYPPVPLLFALLPAVKALTWLIFTHHVAALLGFYSFARGRGAGAGAAFFGAVTFGFSLHVVCMAWTPVALFTAAWLPWAFAAGDRLRAGRRWGITALAAVLALQLSAGYPVLFYLTVLGMLLDGVSRVENHPRLARWGVGFGSALALAVALNLLWALPFTEFFPGTDLKRGKYYQPLALENLLTAFSPFALGHPLQKGYNGPHYWVATYFMGLPALLVMAWGTFLRRVRWPTVFLFACFAVLSQGETAYLGGFLKKVLPGYSLVIRSGFLLSLVVFFGGLTAVEALQGAKEEETRPLKEGWVWIIAGVVLYGLAFGLRNGELARSPVEVPVILAAGMLAWAGRGFLLAWRPWIASLALLLSLFPAALSLRFLLAPSYYESLPVNLPRMDRPGRVFHSPLVLKRARVLEGRTPEEAYYLAKEWMYPNWPLAFRRDAVQAYNTLQWGPARDWVDAAFRVSPSFSKKAADYLNVRYLIGKSTLEGLQTLDTGGPPAPQVEVMENPGALPLWFSVPRAYPAGDSTEDMRRNQSSLFDFSKGCFIDDAVKAVPYRPRNVIMLKRTPNRLELLAEDASSRAPGASQDSGRALLVSSESACPGWICTTDWGQRRILEVVNHAFRGVVLEEGEMHATLSYEPASFRLGLFLSLAAFALMAGLALGPRAREDP